MKIKRYPDGSVKEIEHGPELNWSAAQFRRQMKALFFAVALIPAAILCWWLLVVVRIGG